MKRNISQVFVISALVLCAQMLFAQQVKMDASYFGAPVTCYDKLNLKGSKLTIDGTVVTATAANLNSGVAGSTSVLVSNEILKVYGSNIAVVAGGTITLGAGTTMSGSYPAASGAAITGLAAANLTGNIAYERMTNAFGGAGISIAVTNAGVGGTSSNILWYYRGVVTNVTYLP